MPSTAIAAGKTGLWYRWTLRIHHGLTASSASRPKSATPRATGTDLCADDVERRHKLISRNMLSANTAGRSSSLVAAINPKVVPTSASREELHADLGALTNATATISKAAATTSLSCCSLWPTTTGANKKML